MSQQQSLQHWRAEIARWSLPITGSLPGCPDNLRQGLLVRLGDGQQWHFGDCAPLPNFSAETLEEAELALIDACSRLLSLKCRLRDSLYSGTNLYGYPASVLFAIESALDRTVSEDKAAHQLTAAQLKALPRCRLLSGSYDEIAQQLITLAPDTQVVKVKVGRQSVEADIALVQMMVRLLSPSTMIRLDANRCWTFDQGCVFAKAIDRRRIAFIEEPLRNPHQLPDFARQTGLPIALDESLQWRFPEGRDMPEIFSGLAALVIKPTLAGGIGRCRLLAKLAQRHGLQTVLSSAYESSLGINTLTRLAVKLAPNTAPGLDTLSVFQQSVVETSLLSIAPATSAHSVLPWSRLEPVWSSHD